MSASLLRWSSPETAAVWFDLRDLAPALAVLMNCPVPDDALRTVLEWVDELALPDAEQALTLPRLREVLPAIAVGFLGAHTYAYRPASAGLREALELYDPDGCGRVVGRTLPLASMLAMALHGEDGDRLVRAVHAGLVSELTRVWDEMVRHRPLRCRVSGQRLAVRFRPSAASPQKRQRQRTGRMCAVSEGMA